MENEYKIDEQTAQQDLERMADIMDLDLSIDQTLEPKEQRESQKTLDTVIKAIRLGSLTIDAEGVATYTPRRSPNVPPIVFYEPTGTTLLAADKFSDKQKMHKMYAMIAEMTKVEPSMFSKLKKYDLSVVMAVGGLFLG